MYIKVLNFHLNGLFVTQLATQSVGPISGCIQEILLRNAIIPILLRLVNITWEQLAIFAWSTDSNSCSQVDTTIRKTNYSELYGESTISSFWHQDLIKLLYPFVRWQTDSQRYTSWWGWRGLVQVDSGCGLKVRTSRLIWKVNSTAPIMQLADSSSLCLRRNYWSDEQWD